MEKRDSIVGLLKNFFEICFIYAYKRKKDVDLHSPRKPEESDPLEL